MLLGMYVAGITVFAQRETERSPRGTLILGLAIMVVAFGCLGSLPYWPVTTSWSQPIPPDSWLGLVAVAALIVGLRGIQAIVDPSTAENSAGSPPGCPLDHRVG